ncbi:MAG: hypothetical protein JWM68_3270 [Verrucomicrobiales bacterium]|nr:hypothetical protein [Verrucomicrobiales bacterium]
MRGATNRCALREHLPQYRDRGWPRFVGARLEFCSFQGFFLQC